MIADQSEYRLGITPEDNRKFTIKLIIFVVLFIVNICFFIVLFFLIGLSVLIGGSIVKFLVALSIIYMFINLLIIFIIYLASRSKIQQDTDFSSMKIFPDRLEFIAPSTGNDISLNNIIKNDDIYGIFSEINDLDTYIGHSTEFAGQSRTIKALIKFVIGLFFPKYLDYVHFIVFKKPIEWKFYHYNTNTSIHERKVLMIQELDVIIDPAVRAELLKAMGRYKRLEHLHTVSHLPDKVMEMAQPKERASVFTSNITPKDIRKNNFNNPAWLAILAFFIILTNFTLFLVSLDSMVTPSNLDGTMCITGGIANIIMIGFSLLIIRSVSKIPKEEAIRRWMKVELNSEFLIVYELSPDSKTGGPNSFHLSYVKSVMKVPYKYSDIKAKRGLTGKSRYVYPPYSLNHSAVHRSDLLLVLFKRKMNVVRRTEKSGGGPLLRTDKIIIEIRNEDQDRFFEEVLNRKMRLEK
jgi:hypothetical protein